MAAKRAAVAAQEIGHRLAELSKQAAEATTRYRAAVQAPDRTRARPRRNCSTLGQRDCGGDRAAARDWPARARPFASLLAMPD
jgi:hypothetical protein